MADKQGIRLKMHEMAILETLIFKNFWGEHTPHPPKTRCSRLWRSYKQISPAFEVLKLGVYAVLLSNSLLKPTDGGADDPADVGDDVEEELQSTCAKPKECYSSVEFKASLVSSRFYECMAAQVILTNNLKIGQIRSIPECKTS